MLLQSAITLNPNRGASAWVEKLVGSPPKLAFGEFGFERSYRVRRAPARDSVENAGF